MAAFLCAVSLQAFGESTEPADLGRLPTRVADTGITQGMWLWSDTVFATQSQRTRLLDFCLQYQINHLALAVYFVDTASDSLRLRHEAGLAQLIRAGGESGISVAALRGAGTMAFRSQHPQTLRELEALLDFNARQGLGSRFSDIHYDIEPYNTEPWRAGGDSRLTVQTDYLDFLYAARALITQRGAEVTLSADTPYWYDRAIFAIEYRGEVKHFSEHIQDATDFITLMSYNRDPLRVLEQVAGEADYAHKMGKLVHAGMEVGYVRGEEHFISFQWLPTWRFWRARHVIEDDARQRRGLDGVYIHFYRALYDKLNGEPPWESAP
ncbi:MAG: hypothetical protein HOB49_10395 [Gemmatimonadetes bacterium]|nr:hypothetical protein [Gemmatimonadota bacterium]